MAMYGDPNSGSMAQMSAMPQSMGFNPGPTNIMSGNAGMMQASPGMHPNLQVGMQSNQGGMPGNVGMLQTNPGAQPNFGMQSNPGGMSGNTGMFEASPGMQSNPAMQSNSVQLSPGGISFTPQEIQHYQQLFGMADCDSHGLVTGPRAAAFLQRSGLPRTTLHQIWEIADAQRVGRLDAEGFFVALRLVGHVQANRAPSRDLISIPPPALPDLPGLERRREDSEGSFPTRSGPPSISGNASDISDMQPVITGSMQDVRRAAEIARRAGSGAETPPFQLASASRWSLSMRDKCKYARVFQRTDTDHDGFVEGSDARQLMQRSGLTTERLAEVWEHSDQDADGRLNWPEFLAMMHLITRTVKGDAAPPGPGLPPELAASIYSAPLEAPQELAAMKTPPRSRAASRSTSPVQNWASPLGQHAHGQDLMSPFDAEMQTKAESRRGTGTEPSAVDAASGFGFGAFGAGDGDQLQTEDEDEKKKRKKREKKEKKAKRDGEQDEGSRTPEPPLRRVLQDFSRPSVDEGPHGDGFLEESPGTTSASFERGRTRERQPSFERGRDPGYGTSDPMKLSGPEYDMPGFGSREDRTPDHFLAADDAQKDVIAIATHLEAVIEADKKIASRLQREVDDLDEELRNTRDIREQMDRHMQTERREGDRGAEQRRELETQLQNARQQLKELRMERRAVNLEAISLRRDRDHFTNELAFLKNAYDEDTRNLEALHRANIYLEQSYQALEAHTTQLERQRREIVQQMDVEKDLMRQEERQNSELKNKLERMMRDKSLHEVERKEDALRERQLREMQGQWDPVGPGKGVQERNPPPMEMTDTRSNQLHSWAFSLGAPPADSQAPPRDAGPLGSRNTASGGLKLHTPMDREGV